jgi:hypothetical protein
MIALAGCLRLKAGEPAGVSRTFTIKPRWDLASVQPV